MVTRIQSSRRERKQAALRARIVATAIELFARHGLDRVTVDHIADVADIGKGTVYNYFQAKEDIVVAYMVSLESKLQAKTPDFATYGRNLESVLVNFLQFHFRLKKSYHQFVRVFLAQMFSRSEQFFPYMVEMQKAIDPPLHKLFSDLQRRRLIRKDVNISELIGVFKTVHLGLTAVWAIEGSPFRGTAQMLKQEMKLLCEGLKEKNA